MLHGGRSSEVTTWDGLLLLASTEERTSAEAKENIEDCDRYGFFFFFSLVKAKSFH